MEEKDEHKTIEEKDEHKKIEKDYNKGKKVGERRRT
jgi:ubiquitin